MESNVEIKNQMRGCSSWRFTILNSKKIGDISPLGKSQVQGHHAQWRRLCAGSEAIMKHIPKC